MRDNVPLKIDAYVHRLVVLHGLPAPYAGIIFLQMGYTLEALALDPRNCFIREAFRSLSI